MIMFFLLHKLLVIIKHVSKQETALCPERTLEMSVIINNCTSGDHFLYEISLSFFFLRNKTITFSNMPPSMEFEIVFLNTL